MPYKLQENSKVPAIIGSSKEIVEIHSVIQKVAKTDSTVLILGESGTGKELIAKAIHYSSERANKPFVHVNCAAIPSALLESELFGHEKGAFTGAFTSRAGRFELANAGTVFLDEIGDMPPALQVKILRVLQERCFERIGGHRTINVDVRIIAATNSNLEAAVSEGKFREDLYYRLNVIPITIPPLRMRAGDIPELCNHFLEKYALKMGRKRLNITKGAMEHLQHYHWPGNVRELENLIERLFVLKQDDIITPQDLPEKIRNRGILDLPEITGDDTNPFVNGIDLNTAVQEYEKRLIMHALELHEGVQVRAAKYLNIKRTTLIEKMRRYGIQTRCHNNDR
jgi:transcriptional regulator with GAF, ATPase, and Fis domain